MATPLLKHLVLRLKTCHSISSFVSATSPPSSDYHEPSIVSSIVSLLTHHRSKSRWTYLRSLLSSSPETLTPTHFSQITLHLKSNPHLALRFFHFTLQNSLLTHDLRSFSTVIHVLSRARLKSRAGSVIRVALGSNPPIKLFEYLIRSYRECDSAPFVFDLLIKSCLESKKIDASLEVVRMLMCRGISPQISTCNMLINFVSRFKGSHEGYEVFREVFGLVSNAEGVDKWVVGVRPNVQSFNLLMMGFYKDGDLAMAEEIWSEMGRFGCVADRSSYSVLMAVFCEGGRVREAEKVLEEMRVNGIEPDVASYNTVIGGFCKIGEVEKAEEFFREMGLNGLEGSCLTFEHLINGYCRIGDVDSALLVYKDMHRKDFRPEALTLEVLIGELCEKKRVSEALKVLRTAKKDVTFHPSGRSYEFLIKGLCEEGKMEDALKLQAEMVGKGFKPNSSTYGSFIEGYIKLGNENMAAVLRKEMSETLNQKEED